MPRVGMGVYVCLGEDLQICVHACCMCGCKRVSVCSGEHVCFVGGCDQVSVYTHACVCG